MQLRCGSDAAALQLPDSCPLCELPMSALAASPAFPAERGRADNVWRAPLVPAALAVTAGILADRVASVPLPVSLVALMACLAAWAISRAERPSGLPIAYL